MEDFSGLSSNDTLQNYCDKNNGRLPEGRIGANQTFMISSLEVEDVYKKDFDDITDAMEWVENTLDLSKNWHIKRV